jgi:glycosyltransferase involved in cell wall biosynthesis
MKIRGDKSGSRISNSGSLIKATKTGTDQGSEIRDSKLKKTILFPEYFPFLAGGQVVLLNIIKHLKTGYNVKVIAFNRGRIAEELAKMGIQCDYMRAPKSARRRYFWQSIPLYFGLLRYIRQNKVDLIYAGGYFTAKLCGRAAKTAGVPMIWHKHQIMTGGSNSYLSREVAKYSRYASKIICVSDASRISMERIGVEPGKLVTVHNGMEIPKAGKSAGIKVRKKHGLEKSFVAGTIGYFRKNKGIDILIKSAYMVRPDAPGVKFLIVGEAEPGSEKYEAELKRMADGMDNVIFAGRQDRNEYLPAFDVFVLPSIDEPFALSVLEAAAAGVPVIAFKSGGTPEIIKDGYNGYIAEKIGPESLAEKILLAAGSLKKLRKMGKDAAADVRKNFNLKKQMDEIEEIIKKAINHKLYDKRH